MYCVKCGVKLADSEKKCPLCGTVVFHPDFEMPDGEHLYPADRYPAPQQMNRRSVLTVVTTLFLIPFLITVLVDAQFNRAITWSGYVIGALIVGYVAIVLPLWFRRANPVVFVPISFVTLGFYLLYISMATDGGWLLSLAFPLVGAFGAIVTAVVTLLRYVRRGKFYIFGGAFVALGAVMPLMECLIDYTFSIAHFIGWSAYPLVVLVLVGGMLIFLGISRPARETMERKLFL